jgi:hypothetical protein
MGQGICTIEDCVREIVARTWCDMHYRRWRKSGDPLIAGRILGDSVARFWSYVPDRQAGSCWIWRGAIGQAPRGPGYGQFNLSGRSRPAHVVAYLFEYGESAIPAGLVLDHLCRNQHCVNPSHLEPVTQQENVRRGAQFKVSEERMVELARLHAAGQSWASLARSEGVTPQALRQRAKGRGGR